MAIDVKCPHCAKLYKLKDDMAGKRVQCANKDCRKPFVVTPGANGPTNGAAKPTFPPPLDADAIAAAALADEPDHAGPADTRTVKMTCSVCEYEWTVPWAMQGKNVLCPECKHRQKVPEQKDKKKADWRDRSGVPTLAKVEKLEGVQSAREAQLISGQTIREAGLIEEVYEPRPTSFYAKIAAAILVPLLGLAGGWYYFAKSQKDAVIEQSFDKVFQQFAEDSKVLPPTTVPAFRALMRASAVEYEARLAKEKSRDKAITHLQAGVEDLKAAPRSADRDALFAELASAALHLGGDGDAAERDKTKLNWLPPDPGKSQTRAKVKPNAAELEGVQGLLQRVFRAMLEQGVEPESRFAAARRVARELFALKQPAVADAFYKEGFTDQELPEAEGYVGLEALRAGEQVTATAIGNRLAGTRGNLPATTAAPPSVQALWTALNLPVKGQPLPPAGGSIPEPARLAHAAARMIQNNPAGALEVARQPGTPDGRLRALALAAEWAADPLPFLDEAAKAAVAARQQSDGGVLSASALVRLAAAAGRAGAADKADEFAKSITDEALRAWAKAEALRGRLAAGGTADEAAAESPDDPKKLKPGHAWGRLVFARSSAAKTGNGELAKEYGDGWPKPIGAFGRAGVALGLQDRTTGR